MTRITPNTILLPIKEKDNDDSYGETDSEENLRRGWSKKKSKYSGKGPKPA